MCMCVPSCLHVCPVLSEAQGGQQRASHPLELGLRVVVSTIWVLGSEPTASARTPSAVPLSPFSSASFPFAHVLIQLSLSPALLYRLKLNFGLVLGTVLKITHAHVRAYTHRNQTWLPF